jgi:hypothetical protein
MLTGGALPFEGHIMETMTAKAHREAPPLSTIAPTLVLPDGLEALVTKLVRRISADRPENAREVIEALDQIALGIAISERDPTNVDPARGRPVEIANRTEMVRRKRSIAPWMFAGAVVMAGAVGAWWWFGPHARATVATPVALVAVPKPAPAPAPPPPIVIASNAQKPEIEMQPDVPPATRDRRRPNKHPKHERNVASAIAVPVPDEVPVPDPVPAPPAPPPIVEPPVVKPKTITTVIGNVSVHGSLSEATVRRALERIAPVLRQCAPSSPQNIQVHFAIGESRRATNVQASGAAPTSSCVGTAFSGMRSETAPDVGDVEVDVQITYVAR